MAEENLAPPRISQISGLQKAITPSGSVAPRTQVSLGIPLPSGANTPTITLSASNLSTSTLTCGMTITFGASVNGGTYTIAIGAQATGNITYSTTLATQKANIKAAVEALSNVGTGGVWCVAQTSNVVTIVFTDSVATAIKESAFSATNVALVGGGINSYGSAYTSVPLIPNPTTGVVDTTHYAWLNGRPVQQGKSYLQNLTVCNANSSSTLGVYAPTASFLHTGSQFSLYHYCTGAGYRIKVDDVVVLNNPVQGSSGTAQGGTATSVTLASNAGSTTGQFVGWDVLVTGGTGSGERGSIVSYNGSTQVATVRGGFATPPTSSSTYSLLPPGATFLAPASNGTTCEIVLDFGGVRATRKIDIECNGTSLLGVYVGPIDSITKSNPRIKPQCFVIGNSFDEGTGAWSWTQSLGAKMCDELGWEYWQSAQGGTDYLNSGANNAYRLNVKDRLLPPACSWVLQYQVNTSGNFALQFGGQTTASLPYNTQSVGFTVNLGGPSSGNFTLTLTGASGSATTGNIAYNASASTVQTALNALGIGGVTVSSVSGSSGGPYTVYISDTAGGATGQTFVLSGSGAGLTGGSFSIPTTVLSALAALSNVGVGNVRVCGAYLNTVRVLFLNSLANSGNSLSIVNSTLASNGGAGPSQGCALWQGDLVPYVRKDGNGNSLPFNVVFCNGLNDNTFTASTVATQAAACWSGIQSLFPQATIYVFGVQGPTGTPASTFVTLDAALSAQAATTLKKVNGKVPYFPLAISTAQNLMRTGTGNIASPNGSGDADIKTTIDGTHPTYYGHDADGAVRAAMIYGLWNT